MFQPSDLEQGKERMDRAGNKEESVEEEILREGDKKMPNPPDRGNIRTGWRQSVPASLRREKKGILAMFGKLFMPCKGSEKTERTEPSINQLEEGHPFLMQHYLEKTEPPNDEEPVKAKSRLVLMQGGLQLSEPPKEEEWEEAEEIHLMNNELSELPERPMCPILSELYLQGNYKLTKIPSSFFEHMPALQVLNLSKTSIKSLPDSLFWLVGLKKLFLNDCENFMMLSPNIGELKGLEVLNLEGTEILDVTKEVEKLSNLTCLEVSFYGHISHGRKKEQSNAMIPGGVISALSRMEELNIDVNPDDEQWGRHAEAIIGEIFSLMRLRTLKFYFPCVEQLRHLKWYSLGMGHPSLSHFRFIVGHHSKRIISRLPQDAEFELKNWDRSLTYIFGEGVPEDIKKVLQRATAFYLDRHLTVKKLSEFGIENMEQLKCCIVGECNEIQVIINGEDLHEEDHKREIVPESSSDKRIGLESLEYLHIYYMKNLRSIWEGPVYGRSLSFLKSLSLRTCPKLTTIFTLVLLDNLYSLEELTVEDCPRIKSLVSCENHSKHEPSSSTQEYFLPKLKKVSLCYVPELVSISNGVCIAPKLEQLIFYNCPNLKSVSIEEVCCPYLEMIMGEKDWWEALEWRNGQPDNLDGIFVPIKADDLINKMDMSHISFLIPSHAVIREWSHTQHEGQGKERMDEEIMEEEMKQQKPPMRGNMETEQVKESMGSSGNKKESMGEEMKKQKSPTRRKIKSGRRQGKERMVGTGNKKEIMGGEIKKQKPHARWNIKTVTERVFKPHTEEMEEGSLKSNIRRFTYSEVKRITNDFQTLIEKTGFGAIYLGYLYGGMQVCVKMLSPTSERSKELFQTEAEVLMRVHHRNLLSLVGYCNEGTKIGLICEYMANGSLRELLSDKMKSALSWKERLQIAVDVARGLEYLHHDCEPPIIHRDVKSGNILLTDNLQAKIADFGISITLPLDSESPRSATIAGTYGYMDPEYASSGRLTKKSDVFSFGVVLLELFTGQSAVRIIDDYYHIVEWARHMLERGDIKSMIDPRLEGYCIGSVQKAMETAIACTQLNSSRRPTMTRVVIELMECCEMEMAGDQTWEGGRPSTFEIEMAGDRTWDGGRASTFEIEMADDENWDGGR